MRPLAELEIRVLRDNSHVRNLFNSAAASRATSAIRRGVRPFDSVARLATGCRAPSWFARLPPPRVRPVPLALADVREIAPAGCDFVCEFSPPHLSAVAPRFEPDSARARGLSPRLRAKEERNGGSAEQSCPGRGIRAHETCGLHVAATLWIQPACKYAARYWPKLSYCLNSALPIVAGSIGFSYRLTVA
jgi:hypothetical protein